MAWTAKQVARSKKLAFSEKVTWPTAPTLNNAPTLSKDPDPLGFGTTLAETIAELQDVYRERLRAFLEVSARLDLVPPVRRRIFDAATARGRPVSLDFTITFYPPDASGFRRAVAELQTPLTELADEAEPDDGPEYMDYNTLFDGVVRKYRPKGGWRKGRRPR
jgi:hypothetical protein